jgi:hypothetical protein
LLECNDSSTQNGNVFTLAKPFNHLGEFVAAQSGFDDACFVHTRAGYNEYQTIAGNGVARPSECSAFRNWAGLSAASASGGTSALPAPASTSSPAGCTSGATCASGTTCAACATASGHGAGVQILAARSQVSVGTGLGVKRSEFSCGFGAIKLGVAQFCD